VLAVKSKSSIFGPFLTKDPSNLFFSFYGVALIDLEKVDSCLIKELVMGFDVLGVLG
jgi:tRNA A22 N-methylase